MPTRQQSEFEKSLVEALTSKKVSAAICDAIVANIIEKLSEKFNYYDSKIAFLEEELNLLKNSNTVPIQNNISCDEQKNLKQKIDQLQQSAKRNNIRLFGIREDKNENLLKRTNELFNNKLKIPLNENDILSIYRVGQKINDKPRHVLVVFRDDKIKNTIYNKKKLLKGSGVVMKEDLTGERLEIVKLASEKFGFKNVWTVNGTVFAKTANGIEKISNM